MDGAQALHHAGKAGGELPDFSQAHVRRGKEQWKEAPRHPVVEVVHEARLADARQVPIEHSRLPEHLLRLRGLDGSTLQLRFLRGMAGGLTDGERGEEEPGSDEHDPGIEGLRP